MKYLIDSLPSKPPEFDTLVHLGAGPFFDADLYASLPARRYILVDADPDAVAELQCTTDSARFRVLEKLIAPTPGSRRLRRFSLPALNGLFGLGAMQMIYPRVQEIGHLTLPAITLGQLMAELTLAGDAEHALVISLPGLETDLLAQTLGETSFPFGWIGLSGAGTPLMDEARSLQEALQLAQKKHHFRILAADHNSNPLQPIAILQRDRHAVELESLRRERDDLSKECGALWANRAELEKAHQELVTSFKELESKHTSLVTEREAVQSDHAALSTLHFALIAERDDLATRHSSLVTSFEALQGKHSSLVAERDTLQGRLLETETARDSAAACAENTENAREVLNQECVGLRARVKEAEGTSGFISAERDKLQARATEIEGAARSATNERDALRAKCAELEKTYQELVTRHATLVTSEKNLIAERDSAAKERDALKKTASDRAMRIAELEAQVADQAERQKHIDEEMAKAEGQLEMLKDILRPALS